MKAEDKKCAVCGKKFTPNVANSKCCSYKCRKEAKRIRDAARRSTGKKDVKTVKTETVKVEAKKPVKKVEAKKPVKKVEAKKPVKKVVGKAFEKIVLPNHGSPVIGVKKFLLIVSMTPLTSECECKNAKSDKKTKQKK